MIKDDAAFHSKIVLLRVSLNVLSSKFFNHDLIENGVA